MKPDPRGNLSFPSRSRLRKSHSVFNLKKLFHGHCVHPPMFKYGIFYIFPSLRQGELLVNIFSGERGRMNVNVLHKCGTGHSHTTNVFSQEFWASFLPVRHLYGTLMGPC